MKRSSSKETSGKAKGPSPEVEQFLDLIARLMARARLARQEHERETPGAKRKRKVV